jgi:hypothetical protein
MISIYSSINTNKNLNFVNNETGGWGGHLDIKKDPPRGIVTRKINKVGMDNSLLELIDESGDRNCQSINTYQRGKNPMTLAGHVEYGNYSSSLSGPNGFTKSQASLPNKIMDKGSFRPPIISPQDLLPLSRQNRITTSNITNPMINDYSKVSRGEYNDAMAKSIKELLHTDSVDSGVKNIKYTIQPTKVIVKENVGHGSVGSGVQHIKYTQQSIQQPDRFIVKENIAQGSSSVNSGVQHIKYTQQSIHPDQFIKESQASAVLTAPSKICQKTMDVTLVRDFNSLKALNVLTNPTQNVQVSQERKEYILDRNVPLYSSSTNEGGGGRYNRGEWGDIKNTKNRIHTTIHSNVGRIGRVNDNNGTKADLKYRVNPNDGIKGRCFIG